MGRFHSATTLIGVDVQQSGKTRLANFCMVDFSAPSRINRIHRELRRRLDACIEQRRESALSPGNDDDFEKWRRSVARSERLSRALTQFLSSQP